MARGDRGERLHCTGRSDGMVAVYPGGNAAYGCHIDNVDGDGRDDYGRVLTAVFYLNPSWSVARDGGALRIYAPRADLSPAAAAAAVNAGGGGGGGGGSGPEAMLGAYEVAPTAGKLVLFRADQIVHEVCPSAAERAALTLWFHAGTERQSRQAVASGAVPT